MSEVSRTRYGAPLRIRLDAETLAALETEAKRLGTTVSDVVRQAVAEHLADGSAERLQARLGPVLDRVLQRHISRLAALEAKAVRSATAALYAALAIVQYDGRVDPAEVLDVAEQQAVAYLRGRDADEGEGE